MKRTAPRTKPRVAVSLEMEFGFKRHLETYAGCQRYADEVGWDCVIHPAPERVLKRRPGLERRPFDGILARATAALAEAAGEAGVPLVNVWMNSPAQDVPGVFPDCVASGRMAAEHLVARGFRRLAYFGFPADVDSRLQLEGVREVAGREGLPCSTHRFVRGGGEGRVRNWERFMADLEGWIDSWELPIGLVTCHDLYCRYIIDVLRAKGRHVSQDVAIVGTHNETDLCVAPPPTLTSIDTGFAQIGYRAAALLDELMQGATPPSAPLLLPPLELVPRQSTDVYAADDPLVTRALRFIAENAHRRIAVKDVVAAVATNRRSLERSFRSSLGRSIGAEITRLRVERAKRRMVETNAPMKDVAEEAGFRNADHFYKVFVRTEGIPPTQFRNDRQQVFPKGE